jgi:F420-dependent methylenetetrahydromethanopterin dehydrogenase
MTLDQIQQTLANIANSGDSTFSQFATDINQVVEQAKAGQMTPQDTAEILKDAQRQLAILDDMSQLQFKETLNSCITGLIMIAAAV